LRHSKFIGLREDKEAREVLRDKVMTKNHQAVGFLDRSITDGDID
jgi:hypothetical protein